MTRNPQSKGAPEGVIVDARGLRCPLPVLKARKALSGLASGAELTLLATDPASRIDVAHLCDVEGHALLSVGEDDRVLLFHIRKG